MKTIFKYPVMPRNNKVRLPYKAKFLSFGLDGAEKLCMWFLVDEKTTVTEIKEFEVVGTGWPLSDDDFFDSNFLGTVTQKEFVWHLFRM